jgi:hypothetical protein
MPCDTNGVTGNSQGFQPLELGTSLVDQFHAAASESAAGSKEPDGGHSELLAAYNPVVVCSARAVALRQKPRLRSAALPVRSRVGCELLLRIANILPSEQLGRRHLRE